MKNEKDKKLIYSYSAPTEDERREVESIRKMYLDPEKENDKLTRLRKLNARVKNTAMCVSLSVGIVGLLLFGGGMSLTLMQGNYVWGIILSLTGIVPIAIAYPVYNALLKRGKKKYGEEILRLSGEILNEKK